MEKEKDFVVIAISKREREFISKYRELDDEGKRRVEAKLKDGLIETAQHLLELANEEL